MPHRRFLVHGGLPPRVYWLAAVGSDGRPRVRPIDAIYLDGVIYVGGSGETR